MEIVIEMALQRLYMKRDQAEMALKNKKSIFEAKLTRHEKQLAAFKKKDPPILTMEEMKENAEQAEILYGRIQVCKQLLRVI